MVIPSNATVDQVTEILNKALIKNLDSVDTSSIEWEYQCEGKSTIASKNTDGVQLTDLKQRKRTFLVLLLLIHIHL